MIAISLKSFLFGNHVFSCIKDMVISKTKECNY
uniref:Uncharacterized protein n=1 Tax=Arundo donax TaxID=35708 RepID=A0A0A9FXY8_ARUDO